MRINRLFCDCCKSEIPPGNDWTTVGISYAHDFNENVSFDLCIVCTNKIIQKVRE